LVLLQEYITMHGPLNVKFHIIPTECVCNLRTNSDYFSILR